MFRKHLPLTVIVVAAVLLELTTGAMYFAARDLLRGAMERLLQRDMIAIAMSIVTIAAPEVLFGLFSDDAEVLGLCGIFVIPIVLNYLGAVLRPVMFSLINGSGNARLNLAVALLDGIIVRIGLAYWLGKTHGVIGYWYGAALAGLMPFVIGIIYYWSGKWRTNKYLIKNR